MVHPMRPELKYWNRIDTRHGNFDGYTIRGIKYECSTTDEIAWHVESQESGKTLNNFWIVDQDFYKVSIEPFKNTSLIKIYPPPVTETIDPTERDAVSRALNEWNGQPEQIGTTVVDADQSESQ
jgi:hypothetical protein